jgi:transcriptional regulator with XRE-family HTH domain
LGHIERGTRVASLETLVAICNTLNISPLYLLQASLQTGETGYQFPSDSSPEERAIISRILHLAEETARNRSR